MNNQQNPRSMVLGQFMDGMMGIKRPQPQAQVPNSGAAGQMMGFRPSQQMRKPMPQIGGDPRLRIARLLMGLR